MIIDDDVTFSLMLRTWLGKKGFGVDTAADIAAGRRLLAEGSYDLVLSDMRLPDGDGTDLLQWIAERGVTIPVIVMTGYAEIRNAVVSMKLGARDYVSKPVQPDELLRKIREALANLDGRAAKAILDSEGKLSFDFGEGPVELTADDLLIETTQREGFYTVSDRDITVAIDTVLTPALIEEGFMREIISKVQTMRKEAGFEVTDHIRITMEGSEKVTAVAEAKKAEITSATLAESLTVGTPVGYTKEWDLNGEKATLGVEKI